MSQFCRQNGILFAEEQSLEELAARFGTPLYVYSRAALTERYQAFAEPLARGGHQVCFAVKANGNLGVLNVLARLGAGFDIVSGGELARVLAAGGDPARVVFSGVGKQAWEIERGLDAGIRVFNVESEGELERIGELARRRGVQAPVALRVNPDVDAETHPYIATGLRENKFGVDVATAVALYRQAAAHPGLAPRGLACHIGSQLLRLEPLIEATEKLCALADRLVAEGLPVAHLDLGGGLGVSYRDEEIPPEPGRYVAALLEAVGERPYQLTIEPGRAIAAEAGLLLTRVEYVKSGPERHFAIVDAGLNDLLRPALYDAWQTVTPVSDRGGPQQHYDIVGPVCETGDCLARDRALALAPGDYLAVLGAGAYGFVMSSNYNARSRPAEVLVDGATAHLVRARETVESLYAGEQVLP